ncbi:P1 family peptidase [Shimazuella sp. AN120528]|uniref:P1 family peptidase n=1 Tax=Shimazuella soli TaxID=1892854 RepID=UPI001F0F8AF7|nr:P1 family peptidase [Shimazuella soli]MCH5586485.1 P1 family peptidase [Shimazuella soli]
MNKENNTLTALTGVKVGHATHLDKLTGCTVVTFDRALPVAYTAYGGASSTFNTDTLHLGKSYYRRHGLFVAGGCLPGLASASAIMEGMIADGIGDLTANIINPSISGAIVYDLGTRIAQFDGNFGREAYDNVTGQPVQNGNVGAGTGTTVGKFYYLEDGTKFPAMKSGVGSARVDLGNGVIVCALSVVNPVGNVVLPDGKILAGNRGEDKPILAYEEVNGFVTSNSMNTTISIVGTNADLQTRENYDRVAHLASHGHVRAIYPVHTSLDGDTIFVFSTEEVKMTDDNPNWPSMEVDRVGNAAAKAVQESIYDACRKAESITFEGGYQGIVPSCSDFCW